MNKYLTQMNIQSFRGINDLQIDNIGAINVFVGGNNSGKTSVLEAIQLFCKPNEYNMISISKQRENKYSSTLTRNSLEQFLFLFNADINDSEKNDYEINISGILNQTEEVLNVKGNIVEEIIVTKRIDESSYINENIEENESEIEEVKTFIGTISLNEPSKNQSKKKNIELNNYSRFRRNINALTLINVEMTRTIDHIIIDSFEQLIKEREIKAIAVQMLKNFDSTIEDIRYIKDGFRFVPMIENSNGKYIPLSLYGDGMKKALTILNVIVRAKNGIVLIDEFETGLHTSVMASTFKFMVEIANTLNVQLFLTTHSIEAVDKLLQATKENINEMRVIRLKKDNGKMYAKVTEGQDALENRIKYDMEIRL